MTMDDLYSRELGSSKTAANRPVENRLQELKIRLAVEAYEERRPGDSVMHHYWVKEAGDPEAIGEYFPTGDERQLGWMCGLGGGLLIVVCDISRYEMVKKASIHLSRFL